MKLVRLRFDTQSIRLKLNSIYHFGSLGYGPEWVLLRPAMNMAKLPPLCLRVLRPAMNWLRPAMNKAKFTPSRSGPLAARNTWATARNSIPGFCKSLSPLLRPAISWATARNHFRISYSVSTVLFSTYYGP